MIKKYVKEIDGVKHYKTRPQIIINKGEKCIYNPTEQMILADGWEEFTFIAPEKTINEYKKEKIEEIKIFDNSPEVNIFYIQDIPVWLDKNTRVGLKLRFESEKIVGKVGTTLWYEGQKFSLIIDDAINMLFAIELYASACYDNTQYHIATVNNLDNIEDITVYNFKEGYPEKLHF